MKPEKPSPPCRRRRWLIFLGGLLLGGALVAGALCTPFVQAWLVRRAVAFQPGWRVDFEKFGVGPGGLDARGLDFAMPGLTAKSAPIVVHVLPSRLLRGELNVEQIEVQRLRVEFTPAQLKPAAPTATSVAPLPFPGALALLRAPLPWVVQQTNIDAEFAVNDGGRSVVVSRLSLRGGGVGAGKTGEFAYEFSAVSALLPPGPDNVVKSRGTLRITPDAANGLARIELKGDLALPPYGGLALPLSAFELTLDATPEGERYAATLQFGAAGALDFQGQLDHARDRIDGTLGFRADQSLVAGLLPNPSPAASLAGKIALGFDLKTNALDATLDADLSARDWQHLRPELAVVGALTGKLEAGLAIRGGRVALNRASLTLRGAASAFTLRAALSAPLTFPVSTTAVQGSLALTGLPAAWANPWLGAAAQITQGEFSGEWSLALDPDRTLRFVATRPVEFGPIALTSPRLPAIPALTLRFSPRLTASRTRLAFDCDDLAITSAQGDRVTLAVAATHDLKAKETHLSGCIAGELPSLLASATQALPFTLGARWDATSSPAGLHVAALELTARRTDATEPALSIALQQPIDIGGADELQRQRDIDLLKLKVHDLPLAWISRWLHDHQLTGAWSTGESVLRRAATGKGFVLATREPWTLTDLGVTIGGKTLFRGRARLAPEFELGEDRSTARLSQLELADLDGNRIGGETTFTWQEKEKRFATTLALDAAFPALPGSKDTFGPLTASLRTQASSMELQQVSQIENFHLEVRRTAGAFFTIDAPQPLLFASKPNGELILNSVAPLTVAVDRVPLSWLRPWLPADATIAGTLEPTRLLLVAEPQKFFLRATQPVRVTDFSYARHGVPQVVGATGVFFPGADLRLYHQLQPTFQLGYSGRLHATDGALDVADARAIEFEGALGFLGNDQGVLPDNGDLAARIDFAALHRVPLLAENGIPAAGELVLRANGNLREEAPEFWARLSGVPAADGTRVLPPLELTAHGRVSGDAQSIHFNVTTQFATVPRRSDAAFAIDVYIGKNAAPGTSALRSQFLDVGEFMALADAFTPPRPHPAPASPPITTLAAELPPAGAPPRVYTPLGVPFWGRLRGRFDLELDAVQMKPYRVDGIRGRLELTDRALTLSDLAGEMFAGRWRGGLRVDYDPAAKTGDHVLGGNFHIEQFETARAIQTVFPNEFGSLDTRLDLDAAVRGTGNRWWELLERATGEFALDAHNGVARLTHPQLGTASTVLALAGTLSFSSEMRALGRLLKEFAEMPVDRLHVSGARDAAGDLVLSEFRLDSPQARLLGRGRVPATAGVPLAARKLDLTMELRAKDEMAVILGNMKLLEKKPAADGFLRMKEPFAIGGEVGKPDPSPLYEMLARAVDGSKGSWGLIMRKVQKEIEKQAPPPAPSAPAKKTAALP